MSIIDEILKQKQKEVIEFKNLHGEKLFCEKKEGVSFYKALKKGEFLSVIAEVKPKSPSHGEMISSEEAKDIANLYRKVGVDAISVLTDVKFFGGGYELLSDVSRIANDIPVLAKDFIIDTIQIDLAIISGAAAILLISDILDDEKLLRLYEYALAKKIDVLLEAHKPENVKRCIELGGRIIGINNRDLFTLEENVNHAFDMLEILPADCLKIALSSIKSREVAQKYADAGYDGILIGSVIMKAFNKSAALNSFMGIKKKVYEVVA